MYNVCDEPLAAKVQLDEVPEDSTAIPLSKYPKLRLKCRQTGNSYQRWYTIISELFAQRRLKYQNLIKASLQRGNLQPFGIFLDHCEINTKATNKRCVHPFVSNNTPSKIRSLPSISLKTDCLQSKCVKILVTKKSCNDPLHGLPFTTRFSILHFSPWAMT